MGEECDLRQENIAAASDAALEAPTGSSWAYALWAPAAMGGVWGYSVQMAVGGAPEQYQEPIEPAAVFSSSLSTPAWANVGRWADCEDDEAALPRAAYPEWHPMRSQMQGFGAGADRSSPRNSDRLLPHEWTTVMIKGVPTDWTRDSFTELLDAEGFCAEY